MYPFIKTGGLADVAYALPKSLNKLGNDVRVFLPKYSQINTKYLVDAKYVTSVDIYGEVFNIISAEIDGVTAYLVENRTYFERDSLYDCWDNDIQYVIPGAEGRAFDLYSFGADGKEGGEGTDADIYYQP